MPLAPFSDDRIRCFVLPFLKGLFVAMAKQFGDLVFEMPEAKRGSEIERGFVEVGELAAEDIIDHIKLQYIGIGLIQHAEGWVEAGLSRVRAKQRRAEGVDRADAGRVDLAKLAEPEFLGFGGVGRLQSVVTGFSNAGTHLAGSSVGECDRDQLAETSALGVGVTARIEVREEAFGKDERFAATGAGGESYRVFAAVDCGALFGGEGGHSISDRGFRIAD